MALSFPRLLILQVFHNPSGENNFSPDLALAMENGQYFTLASVIQGGSLTYPGLPTPAHILTFPGDQGRDFICIYQQVSDNATNQVKNSVSSPSLSSPMLQELIRKAAELNISLSPGTQIPGDGNCVFAALIANINSRPVFQRTIKSTPSQARWKWLTGRGASVCRGRHA